MSSVKIVVGGPPRSGKSVFLGGLMECLPKEMAYLYRACPDGEGSWTYRTPDTAALRRKGTFTKETVDWYVRCLQEIRLAPVVLVDIGGRITPENTRIIKEGGITHAIVLAATDEAAEEWRAYFSDLKLQIIATVKSEYTALADVVDGDILVCHHLERGEDVSSRPAIQEVATRILSLGDAVLPEPKEVSGVIRTLDLAKEIGKEPQKVVLTNGREVTQITWSGEDLPALSRLLHNRSAELPPSIDVDGHAPAWLVTAITHEVHPRAVRLNSPDGFVAVGVQRPSGDGAGENLEFSLTAGENGWITLLCQQKDPSIPLDPEDLSGVIPPEIPMGSKVILSGRMPNWLATSLAMAYHGIAKALACFQPGIGATVAWTHSKSVRLGEVIN